MPASTEFQNMTALVTGASSGIGAETAVAFGSRGAYVLMHYNSSRAGAEEALGRVRQAGGDGELLAADLSTEAGIGDLVTQLGCLRRPIDILINNAGSLVERSKFLDLSPELWNRVITLNWTSAMRVAQAVVPAMIERKRGFIVNLSSIAARNGGGIGAIAYASSKAAVSCMTKGMAKEFAPHGIRVNAVSPGTIDNNFHRKFSNKQLLDAVVAATPLGRLGESAECAEVIVFLCSDRASFIQGQIIEVNGGMLMV
jgi:3-oxoacyl-[acyl-carrier protein] reductase